MSFCHLRMDFLRYVRITETQSVCQNRIRAYFQNALVDTLILKEIGTVHHWHERYWNISLKRLIWPNVHLNCAAIPALQKILLLKRMGIVLIWLSMSSNTPMKMTSPLVLTSLAYRSKLQFTMRAAFFLQNALNLFARRKHHHSLKIPFALTSTRRYLRSKQQFVHPPTNTPASIITL